MRTFVSTLCLPLFLFLFPLSAQKGHEKKFSDGVSQVRLLSTVRDLVGYGNRMGGTTSGDRSSEYVHRAFRSQGLKAEVVTEPERLAFSHELWTLKVSKPRKLGKLIRHEWLAGFSPSVKKTQAPLIDLDIERSDEMSLKGRVGLTALSISPTMYNKLAESGIVCILSYAPNLPNAYADWAMVTSLPSSSSNPIPLFNISRGNGLALADELKKGTEIEITFNSMTTIAEGKPKTVVATLEGKSDDYYIVCAHGDSDSGGPGADDNASGVAGVIELARVIQGLVRDRLVPKPEKTIKFIVWGVEYYSASQYLKRHSDELEKIVGVINYDQIGTGATRNCLYFESNDIPHNEALLKALQKVGEDYHGKKGFWEEATTNPSQGGTDSYAFMPEFLDRLGLPRANIPSTTIFTAAWNEVRTVQQTDGWTATSWKGHPDSVVIDYSAYYHSALDIPKYTTEKEPFNVVGAVKAVGIALLRLAW